VVDNGLAGAIAPREDDFTHPRVYFATEDIEASVKRIHELGGTSETSKACPASAGSRIATTIRARRPLRTRPSAVDHALGSVTMGSTGAACRYLRTNSAPMRRRNTATSCGPMQMVPASLSKVTTPVR
jgi:hypothetical protein